MKRIALVAVGIFFIALFAFYILSKKNSNSVTQKEQTLVATVKVEPVESKTLSKNIIAYGVVEAKPGKIKSINLGFDCVIYKTYVQSGQVVKKGQALFSFKPTPVVESQLMQAQNSLKLAEENLNYAREKFSMHLITKQDLSIAQNAYMQAKAAYDNLKGMLTSTVVSPMDGIVTKLNYTDGATVASGSSILEIANSKDIIVRCGVEPEDIAYLKQNMDVSISLIDYDKKISGKIASIASVIDPSTHLVNVYVVPDSNYKLLLNGFAEVSIPIFAHTGLTVPKSALLFENGHYVVYIVKNGLAQKHIVDVIIKNQDFAQIAPCGILKGDLVVVQGAYELKNGMKIKAEK